MPSSSAGYKHASGEVTPTWEQVYRGEADLAAAWGDAGRNLAVNTSHPKELVIRVKLPGLTSAAPVDLDVGPENVALCVPGQYKLEVTLRNKVDDAKGKAKFDKVKQQLELLLPVLPPPKPAALPQRTDAMVTEVEAQDDESPAAPADTTDAPKAGKAGANSSEDAEGQESTEASSKAEGEQQQTSHDASGPTAEEQLTENERKWREMHASSAAAQEAAAAAETAAAASSQSEPASDQPQAQSTSNSADESSMKAAAALASAGVAPPVPAAPTAPVPARPVLLKPRLNNSLVEDID